MNKSAVFITLGVTLAFAGVTKAMASSTVEISNNVNGGSSHVSVQQNTSNTTNSYTRTSGTSHVKVTVNGKTIETDKNENINYQSEDGTTKVQINNNTTNPTPPEKPTLSPQVQERLDQIKKNQQLKKEEIEKKKNEIKKKVEEKKAEIDENHFDLKTFFEKEFPFLKKLFSLLPQA